MTPALPPLRYPAIPLITHDPYFSIWSFSDHLTEDWTRHWTGTNQGMGGLIRIDSHCYRFAGNISHATPMTQRSVEVWPTRTVYVFEAAGIRLTLTFLTPSLPHNLDLLSRPLTYVLFDVVATDGRNHEIALMYNCGGEWCVDQPDQSITWDRARVNDLEVLRLASAEQRPLNRSGDNLRIDWGSLYLVVPGSLTTQSAIGPTRCLWQSFADSGHLPARDDPDMPRAVSQGYIGAATSFDLGRVGATTRSAFLMVAYDDVWSIEYLGCKRRAYWRRGGMGPAELFTEACRDFPVIQRQCTEYDTQLMDHCRRTGGEKYARLCALSFRQAIAAHKLVADHDGTPLFFSKENFSNGCIATVDVTYPSAPLFLLTQPELVKGMLIPILDYAGLKRWKFPFAPHDLGTYPLANGQVYGGGEKDENDQMPVEECGNMLLLCGALSELHDELPFVQRYWPTLSTWAQYLKNKGYDPDNQLCTDDFAGHLAHNTNLSLKAILALGAYAQMAKRQGLDDLAREYHDLADGFARRWVREAATDDHFRLAFNQPDSWSQKYNLVWDRLLGLNLFPRELATAELAWYRKKQQPFGLPLDSRKTYTKLDWILWSATLTGQRDDFDALLNPVYDWLGATPTRVPLTDWYETTDGKQVGFQARSVVGGVFIWLLGHADCRAAYRQLKQKQGV